MKTLKTILPLLLFACSLHAAEQAKGPSPAKVEKTIKETDLGNITLQADAEKRLGITLATAERRKTRRSRLLGGEVILPARNGQDNSSQSIQSIIPSLTAADLVRMAQAQIDADAQVEQARVQLEAAKLALTRADQMLQAKAGAVRVVDDAKVQVSTAELNLKTAIAKRELLGPPVLHSANQPLLWIRVPVYAGDLGRLDPRAEATVNGLADAPGTNSFRARPVSAPPSANAAASSVDFFYELANSEGAFRLGQRVAVNVPMREEEESLIIPWSSVVYDINGGTWVYEKTGELAYARRRVQVRRVSGNEALLASGVKPGARVVTEGAAELFGVEFGVGK